MSKQGILLRKQRGMELAATRSIRKAGKVWSVPSATGDGTRYTVDYQHNTCSCPDYETHKAKCKHIFAVFYVRIRQQNRDGSITDTTVMAATRTTYPQNWPAYNAAQTAEKSRFQELLHHLCAGLPDSPQGRGRLATPIQDAIFAATFKVYSTFSGRRFDSDLAMAEQQGWISKKPSYNTVFDIFHRGEVASVLRLLIERSALPLKGEETIFAADSTGFTSSRSIRWHDHKYGRERRQHDWAKGHFMCGVKTHIVTAVEVGEPNASDARMLPTLLESTAKNFTMKEVLADKGYLSRSNVKKIASFGSIPFVMVRNGVKPLGDAEWAEMLAWFEDRNPEFLDHYHQRSNIEALFSAMKRTLGDSVRSQTDVAMRNEVYCKALCHNLIVLVRQEKELGIDMKKAIQRLNPRPVAQNGGELQIMRLG